MAKEAPNIVYADGERVLVGDAKAGGIFVQKQNRYEHVQSNPNWIINGNFDYWQRTTSPQTSSGYGSDDRWINQNNGSSKEHSRQNFALGQVDVPGEPRFFSRTVVTSVAGAGNLVLKEHRIESVRTLAGKWAALSFYVKADATKNIAVLFYQNFGSVGAPSANVIFGITTVTATTSWTKKVIVVQVPSIAGKTLGSTNDDFLGIEFWFDAGSSYNSLTNSLGQQSGTFDIAQVKLEEGSVATAYSDVHPLGYTVERYYQIGLRVIWSGSTVSGNFYLSTAHFRTIMRAVPSSYGALILFVSGFPAVNPSNNAVQSTAAEFFIVANSTLSSGFYGYSWFADAEL